MSKKQLSESSLKNLAKGKPFSADCKEHAREAQRKAVIKRQENRTMKQVAEEKLNKIIAGFTFQEISIDKLIDYVKTDEAKPETIIKILEFLRDTSGQKPSEKLDVTGVELPQINIEGL